MLAFKLLPTTATALFAAPLALIGWAVMGVAGLVLGAVAGAVLQAGLARAPTLLARLARRLWAREAAADAATFQPAVLGLAWAFVEAAALVVAVPALVEIWIDSAGATAPAVVGSVVDVIGSDRLQVLHRSAVVAEANAAGARALADLLVFLWGLSVLVFLYGYARISAATLVLRDFIDSHARAFSWRAHLRVRYNTNEIRTAVALTFLFVVYAVFKCIFAEFEAPAAGAMPPYGAIDAGAAVDMAVRHFAMVFVFVLFYSAFMFFCFLLHCRSAAEVPPASPSPRRPRTL